MGCPTGVSLGCFLFIDQSAMISSCLMNEPLMPAFIFSALSCFQCELLNSEGICEKGESTCETEHDQQCSMVEVSTGVYAREVSGGPACSWEGDKVPFTVWTTKQCVCADASLKGKSTFVSGTCCYRLMVRPITSRSKKIFSEESGWFFGYPR